MPIDQIGTAGIANGAVVPADLSTGAPIWDASGNVGIGTTVPSQKVSVGASVGSVGYGIEYTPTDQEVFSLTANTATGEVRHFATTNYFPTFWANNAERMRLDTAGNFGINSATPQVKLEVGLVPNGTPNSALMNAGNVNDLELLRAPYNSNPAAVSNAGAKWGLRMVGRNDGAFDNQKSAALYAVSEDTTAGYNRAVGLAFHTSSMDANNTERARIDSSGNLLVNTTTAPSYSIFTATGRGTSPVRWEFGASITGNGSNFHVFNSSGVGVYVANGATSWTANSDERIKDIIEPISNAAEKVASLRTVIGKYKSDADGTRRAFLIAQDVQAVLPEAVNIQDDEIGTLGLQYTDTIPLLVAAVKEQQAMIEELKAKVAALEAK